MNVYTLARIAVYVSISTACAFFVSAMATGESPGAVPAPTAEFRSINSTSGDDSPRKAAATGADAVIQQVIERFTAITPAQKEQMARIIDAFEKRTRELQAANHEKLLAAIRALEDARAAHDGAATARALQQLNRENEPLQEAHRKLTTELENILTPGQRKELRDGRAKFKIETIAAPVRLSDVQMNRAMAAYPEAYKAHDDEKIEEGMANVVLGVLTPEQKEQVSKHHAVGYMKGVFGRASLTDEQKKKVSAIVDELANDRRFDSDWPYHNVMEKALHERVESLLTADQKRALESDGAKSAR